MNKDSKEKQPKIIKKRIRHRTNEAKPRYNQMLKTRSEQKQQYNNVPPPPPQIVINQKADEEVSKQENFQFSKQNLKRQKTPRNYNFNSKVKSILINEQTSISSEQ